MKRHIKRDQTAHLRTVGLVLVPQLRRNGSVIGEVNARLVHGSALGFAQIVPNGVVFDGFQIATIFEQFIRILIPPCRQTEIVGVGIVKQFVGVLVHRQPVLQDRLLGGLERGFHRMSNLQHDGISIKLGRPQRVLSNHIAPTLVNTQSERLSN